MANDPNRDILPVKEVLEKEKGNCDRVDLNVVSRYKRPELEDRFIKLYEENNDLKRLKHSLEGKVKKLGTKLLRVVNEKKNAHFPRKEGFEAGPNEELEMKVLELEHENYVLKDKNIVLKQQLANHSRQHMAAHRSPVLLHRAHGSPRLSQRQVSVPNINEASYTLSNRNNSSELQLRDAETHISALNDEIKLLHSQVQSLQAELEKVNVVSQKSQLGENIELIKLRRLQKQLEAQLRVAEHNQKLSNQDIARLQKENEEAVQIIAEKQNEIIDLQNKLDELNYNNLELQELRGTVLDLTKERQVLSERCDTLLKTVSEKVPDTEAHSELKRQLAEVRKESSHLRQELDLMQIQVLTFRTAPEKKLLSTNDCCTQTEERKGLNMHGENKTESTDQHITDSFIPADQSPYDILQKLAKLRKETIASQETATQVDSSASILNNTRNSSSSNLSNALPQAEPPLLGILQPGNLPQTMITSHADVQQGLMAAAERLNLQREVDYLRDILRAQTQRCDAQDNEILRLQQEIKLNEDRYQDVFQQRDLFFRLLDKSVSGDESGSCLSGHTYTKNIGTYTKSSPIQTTSQVASPVHKLAQSIKAVENIKPNECSPMSSPKPVPRARSASAKSKTSEVGRYLEIKVSILWLQLEEKSKLLADDSVKALYVDFTILDESSEAFETPQALPKPGDASTKSHYNFTAVVQWTEEMSEKLKKPKNSEDDVIVFNVVSEPTDEGSQEVQCPVVGMSSISHQQFLQVDSDEDLQLPIFYLGKERKCCGTLAVRLFLPPSFKAKVMDVQQ